jgi:hypothetical protein
MSMTGVSLDRHCRSGKGSVAARDSGANLRLLIAKISTTNFTSILSVRTLVAISSCAQAMAWSRSLAVAGVFGAAFLALIAGFILTDTKGSKSALHCVTTPTPHYITTLNVSLPKAKCFRVENGVFTEVLEEIPDTNANEITYLDGYVLPGIIESHGHILPYGEMLESVSLYEAESVEDVRERIKEFLKRHQGEGYGTRDKWVRGIGWDQKYFGGVMPTAVSTSYPSIYYT